VRRKSRERIRDQRADPPANATIAAIRKMSFRLAMKLARATAATAAREGRRHVADRRRGLPVGDRGGEGARAAEMNGVAGRRHVRADLAREDRAERGDAVAKRPWRKVLLIPDAMPAWRGGTTAIAVEASGGLIKPTPRPPIRKAGSRWVQCELTLSRASASG